MSAPTPARPLEGKVVLDLTTALSGPYATLLLAGLGARVIKIENPLTGGDSSRNNSPYLTRDGLSIVRTDPQDMSVSMLLRGRGKESVVLDLKSDKGRDTFLDLVAAADIVVENFTAGVTDRLGIGYSAARERNPRIVYTSISGYGAQGTTGGGKAMDTIVQALSGMMLTAGSPGQAPVRFGVPIADLVAPLYAVIGTLAAILHSELTGQGQFVDVSMLGALTSLVACEPFDVFEKIGLPLRTGDYVPRLAPFGTFATRDGWIALCAPTDAFARAALTVLGGEALADDPRFRRRDDRVANADELHALIADWAKDLTVAEATQRLEEAGAPVAPVRTTAEAVRDPLVLQRSEVVPLVHPDFESPEELLGSGLPIMMSECSTSIDKPAPHLGENTAAVLRELLGYDDDRIRDVTSGTLRQEGVARR